MVIADMLADHCKLLLLFIQHLDDLQCCMCHIATAICKYHMCMTVIEVPWNLHFAGLGTGQLVAAIVAPVIIGLLLLGVAAWWLCRRRHRQQGQATSKVPADNSVKDLEMGNAQQYSCDMHNVRDRDITCLGSAAEVSA